MVGRCNSKLAWGDSRFWRLFLAVAGIMMASSAALNFVVNPFKLYYFNLLPESVVNPRQLKGRLLRSMDPPPEVLILGSSRVMTLDPQSVTGMTGKPCFNFGGPSAMAEDYLATLRYAREYCGGPIDTVIVGVDLEALHPKLPELPQGKFLAEYAAFLPVHDGPMKVLTERITMLFSLEQTNESIGSITHALKRKTGRPSMDYRADGMTIMERRDAQIEKGTFDLERTIARRVRRYPERSLALSSYSALGEARKGYWIDFLEYCRENGITVYAYLTPYHPAALELIEEEGAGRIINEARSFLEKTTAAHGGVFRDYLRLGNFGGDRGLFYDEIHMRPENGDILLAKLLKGGAGN